MKKIKRQRDKERKKMLSLNKDTKIKILCSISDRDLINCSLVCKGLHEVYKQEDLWVLKTFCRFTEVLCGKENIRKYLKKSKLKWSDYYKSLIRIINLSYKSIRNNFEENLEDALNDTLTNHKENFGQREDEFSKIFKQIHINTFDVISKEHDQWINKDFIELYTSFRHFIYEKELDKGITILEYDYYLEVLGKIFSKTAFLLDKFDYLLGTFYYGEGLMRYIENRNTEKIRKDIFRKFLYHNVEYLNHVVKFMTGDEIIEVLFEEYVKYDFPEVLNDITIVNLIKKAVKRGADKNKICIWVKEIIKKSYNNESIWHIMTYVKTHIDKDFYKKLDI